VTQASEEAVALIERFQLNAFEPINNPADKDLLRRLVDRYLRECSREALERAEKAEREARGWADIAKAAAARVHALESAPAALTAVGMAMDALESDASVEQRRAAWDLLRDAFYPLVTIATDGQAPIPGEK
jgi:hypothetical protein